MLRIYQRTLCRTVGTSGIGLHSGRKINVTISPAAPDTGVVFVRTDRTPMVEIPATPHHVVDTQLATTLGTTRGGESVRVGTVEHLLSALYGLGIDNARVELDGSEVPVMDGSAGPFVYMLRSAGIQVQKRFKRFMVVRRPVEVRDGEKRASLTPARSFGVTATIDFDHPLIRSQSYRFEFSDKAYHKEISRARTFGFLRDVEQMKAVGLGLGGSLDNAIVIDDFSILNPDGLRFPDEFVRHKILDTLGDLALLGMPVIGHLTAVKSGHALNHALTTSLLADPENFEIIEVREPADLGRFDVAIPAFGVAEAV